MVVPDSHEAPLSSEIQQLKQSRFHLLNKQKCLLVTVFFFFLSHFSVVRLERRWENSDNAGKRSR